MPTQQTSIVPLILLWERYVHECRAAAAEPDLVEFAGWMLRQPETTGGESDRSNQMAGEPWDDAQYAQVRLVDKIGILIWRLSRFMRLFFKQHFEGHPLQSIDEFSLLAGAHYMQKPTKTELFRYDLMETTTGIQMLARLMKQGLAEETIDPVDRRLKRVALTPAGQSVHQQASEQMDHISDELLGILSEDELRKLEGLLSRLNHYHTKRFQNS